MLQQIIEGLLTLRQKNPLIHQITNYVSVNDCANVTLAIGASPVMAQDINEVAEMAKNADALVLNIGTFQSNNEEAFFAAGKKAKACNIPVIFDPVGAGATAYRTKLAKRILEEVRPDIIRCNRTEFRILSGKIAVARGVDAVDNAEEDLDWAMDFCREYKCIAAVTGKQDLIFDGARVCRIDNGDALLTRVTGTGCMTSALTASFAAIMEPFSAAAAGVLAMGVAGERAREALLPNEGTGSYRIRLLDAIFRLNEDSLSEYARIQLEELRKCSLKN